MKILTLAFITLFSLSSFAGTYKCAMEEEKNAYLIVSNDCTTPFVKEYEITGELNEQFNVVDCQDGVVTIDFDTPNGFSGTFDVDVDGGVMTVHMMGMSVQQGLNCTNL